MPRTAPLADHDGDPAMEDGGPEEAALDVTARFWRNRFFARMRHRLTGLRGLSTLTTRMHAKLIRLSGGRVRRSFLFTGGMPILVLTTIGRRSGQSRSTPVAYFPLDGNAFAILASNAGSDRPPAWWLNLQARPDAEILVDGEHRAVVGRVATPGENDRLWGIFARRNPGFDEYRRLTDRRIPIVILAPPAPA